ncbi:MAG: hypothetical protein A2Y62_14635 [Candidatus Fischerbacteria bacterium RBG_13_37_8]|uniref:Uncharacterized protein n=1 Tax=Candidatus Fischerbacteria bacterium RBG_13_37_8 TaxID=1817863 RepID=A0A1F5VMP6_9BACT|nr:MAG: hypothetical protein A2Y62_14635 [Candidatus Fischerbacteria bacterium RBG_13_37_8]
MYHLIWKISNYAETIKIPASCTMLQDAGIPMIASIMKDIMLMSCKMAESSFIKIKLSNSGFTKKMKLKIENYD